jgi:prophage maintenance system killer protein
MIDGDKTHVNNLKNRFLTLNGYEVGGEYDHLFNEAYQVAYSLRVIIR